MRLTILILLTLISHSLTAEKLTKEIYFDAENSAAAYKNYIYDDQNNITEIKQYSGAGELQVVTKYQYKLNLLTYSEELSPFGKKIKYSTYKYTDSRIAQRIDYSEEEKIIMRSDFVYTSSKLHSIKQYKGDGTYLGRREFVFDKDGYLSTDTDYSETGKELLVKEYLYKNDNVDRIIIKLRGNIIRTVKREYSPELMKKNELGYKYNFTGF